MAVLQGQAQAVGELRLSVAVQMPPCHPDEGGHFYRQVEIFFVYYRSVRKISPSSK